MGIALKPLYHVTMPLGLYQRLQRLQIAADPFGVEVELIIGHIGETEKRQEEFASESVGDDAHWHVDFRSGRGDYPVVQNPEVIGRREYDLDPSSRPLCRPLPTRLLQRVPETRGPECHVLRS